MSMYITQEEERNYNEYKQLGAQFREMNDFLVNNPEADWKAEKFPEKKFLNKWGPPSAQPSWFHATLATLNLSRELRIPLKSDWKYMAELLFQIGTSQGHSLMKLKKFNTPSEGGLMRRPWTLLSTDADSPSYNTAIDWVRGSANCLYPPIEGFHYWPRRQITANRKPAYFLSPDKTITPRDTKMVIHIMVNSELMCQDYRFRNWFEHDACNMHCQSLASPWRFDYLEITDVTDIRNPRVINIEQTPIEFQGKSLTKQMILDKLKLLNGRSSIFQRNAKNKNVQNVIWRWNNDCLYDPITDQKVTTQEQFEVQKKRAFMRGIVPAMESLMIKWANELTEFGIQMHYQFTSPIEIIRLFKNSFGMAAKPHQDSFEDRVLREELFRHKPLTDKITGYPLMLTSPVGIQHGVQRNHNITLDKVNHNNTKIPNFEEKFRAFMDAQTINAYAHHVVVISSDKYMPWREGIIPHTQDLAFWSFWCSTTTPVLAENSDVTDYFLSQDKPPTVVAGANLPIGKRKNLLVVNSKKVRAEHLLLMHKMQAPDPRRTVTDPPVINEESYEVVPDGHRITNFSFPAPILKTFNKPSGIITDNPSMATVHARLAATLLFARDELWVEHEGFSDKFKEKQWSTITSQRGTAFIAAGDWIAISGSEKFKLAQYAQQRDLLVTQAQVQETYSFIHAVQGYKIRQTLSSDIRQVFCTFFKVLNLTT